MTLQRYAPRAEALLLAVACVLILGCGADGPAVAPVTGTVMYKNQPVEGAQVMFTPAEGRPAEGTTDALGKFSLSTFATGDGAVLGEHRVTIVKMVKQDPNDPYSPTQNMLPAQYASATQSPMIQTVTADGVSDLQLELRDP